MKTALLAAAVFLSLAASAFAGNFFIYDNYGNSILGQQNSYGGMASDNFGNAIYWSGRITPSVPLYRPQPYQFYSYPVYSYPLYRGPQVRYFPGF